VKKGWTMFIVCASCGVTIPDDVQLCPYCGKPVIPTPKPKAEEESWDYCGISASRTPLKRTWSGKIIIEYCYMAEAMGKNGRYTIAATDKYTLEQKSTLDPDPMGGNESDRRAATERLNGLIKKLQDDGWEMLPSTGSGPLLYRFKRKANPA
jgi:hypothetical protein